tara:strand:- start:1017 stop:1184 length:168 start_codon:yes stop_codon:yes gene_type:complete
MDISQENIQARIAELVKQEQALRADLNAVLGAIQDCAYWQKQLLIKSQEKQVTRD